LGFENFFVQKHHQQLSIVVSVPVYKIQLFHLIENFKPQHKQQQTTAVVF
jgi:hypothetical protein